ncbi:MAG: epoxyqueuosine reductase QueH [Ruminococcus sp.]|nr:epoxyqueuosine reductase QueH [Ruminococcus sp.]
MQKRNYQKELDKLLESLPKDNKPTLLLHACCAPCSSYTLEYLSRYFRITVFFYNPNISPEEEFTKRAEELRRLISEMPLETPVGLIVAKYDSREFYDAVKGMEDLPEGGERCYVCYKLRLDKTALAAAENGFDYFATTLSISPYKNAQWLNDISEELAEIYSVKALPCDFKKRGGYKRSIELSAQYSLYRQDYCGCVYSRREREVLKAKRSVSAE